MNAFNLNFWSISVPKPILRRDRCAGDPFSAKHALSLLDYCFWEPFLPQREDALKRKFTGSFTLIRPETLAHLVRNAG